MIFNKVQTSAGKKMLESKTDVDYDGVFGKPSNETKWKFEYLSEYLQYL